MSTFTFEQSEQFWYNPHRGPIKRFETPDDMVALAVKAFQHLEQYPFKEDVVFHHKGSVVRTYKNKLRPFSKKGVALRMGVTTMTLDSYREQPGFAEVLDWIDEVIYTQKFEAAAADMLNANFIARDLGLADKKEVTGKDGGPLQSHQITDEEALKNEARRLGIPLDAFGLGGGEEEEG